MLKAYERPRADSPLPGRQNVAVHSASLSSLCPFEMGAAVEPARGAIGGMELPFSHPCFEMMGRTEKRIGLRSI